MRHMFVVFLLIIYPVSVFSMEREIDSLLKVLDKVISERSNYTEIREAKIIELKQKKSNYKTQTI